MGHRLAVALALALAVALAVAIAFGGCSARQLYHIGQQWQRNECQKIDDRTERLRCEQSAALSYERYTAEIGAAAKP